MDDTNAFLSGRLHELESIESHLENRVTVLRADLANESMRGDRSHVAVMIEAAEQLLAFVRSRKETVR